MTAALANHLWHCTWIALAAALSAWFLRKHQAKIRFWVWFAASAKFVIPFSILMNFGAQTAPSLASQTGSGESWASPTAVLVVQPFGPESASIAEAHPPASEHNSLGLALATVWLLGFMSLGWKRWRDWQMLRSALRSSTEAEIQAEIEVRYCPGLIEPSVIGWPRPVLLLPSGIDRILSLPQMQAVLIHEICHARRRDNALAAFHMFVELCFWFHPLVWWIGAQLIAERERACDEEVLRKGVEPFVYVGGILAVCRHYACSPLATASGVTGSSLKRRIEDIMTNRTFRNLNLFQAAALVTAGVGVLALPFFTGLLNAPLMLAQSTPSPRFESLSVRNCQSSPDTKFGRGYAPTSGMLNTGCMPLADEQGLGLIQRAYVRFGNGGGSTWPNIVPVKGKPWWFESNFYEVIGKAARNTPQEILEGPMLRAALEERFRLQIHEEAANVPVYTLTVEPRGSRLTAFMEGSCIAMPVTYPAPQAPAGHRYCGVRVGLRPPAVDAEGVNLGEFSKLLSLALDRPVMDKTGVQGKFTVHLEFAPDASTPRFRAGGELARFATAPTPNTKPIAGALAELGLRLEANVGIQRQLVIDHVEKPTIE